MSKQLYLQYFKRCIRCNSKTFKIRKSYCIKHVCKFCYRNVASRYFNGSIFYNYDLNIGIVFQTLNHRYVYYRNNNLIKKFRFKTIKEGFSILNKLEINKCYE